jgi:hypothetical protein
LFFDVMKSSEFSSFTVCLTHQYPNGWNEFVLECEPSHFEQTSWWGQVEATDGWSPRYAVIWRNGLIQGGALVLVRRMRRLGWVGYCTRGPLWRRDACDQARLLIELRTALTGLARKERLRLLVVTPPYEGDAVFASLQEGGFLLHPHVVPPSGLSQGTITVDLKRAPAEIEQRFRRTTRQEVARGRRKGVVISQGGAGDIASFWDLHLALCRRRQVASNVPGAGYVLRAWEELDRQGYARLYKAHVGGSLVCSLICFTVGTWCYAWRIGWSGEHADCFPTKVMYAHVMQQAAQEGLQYFDFMGVDWQDVIALEHGDTSYVSPTLGVTIFKLGFGGMPRKIAPTLDWFPNAAMRLSMRLVGQRFFSSPAAVRLLERMRGM